MLTKSPEVGVDYTIPHDIRGSGDLVFPNTVEEDHDRGIKISHNEENLDNEIET